MCHIQTGTGTNLTVGTGSNCFPLCFPSWPPHLKNSIPLKWMEFYRKQFRWLYTAKICTPECTKLIIYHISLNNSIVHIMHEKTGVKHLLEHILVWSVVKYDGENGEICPRTEQKLGHLWRYSPTLRPYYTRPYYTP